MKELKYFNLNSDYTAIKDSFEYPTVSYVEENTKVHYMEKPIEFISLHFEIKNEEQLQVINELIVSIGDKLPLLMRSDLIAEAKLNEQDITDNLHKDGPHVFTGTTVEDKMEELLSLVMNESGLTDYVISVDGPFEVGNSWDLGIKFKEGITDCIGLFYASPSLNEIPESLFSNNTAVTDFTSTFASCKGLTSIPENLFSNNTKVTSFGYTFNYCTELTSIPANLFSTNTAVTDFSYTLSSCSGLTSIQENLFSNNTNVTDFMYTFYGCTELTSIPENLFANNTAVTNFTSTFYGCSGLTNIPENLFQYNKAVTSFYGTFSDCSGLTGNVPTDTDGTPIYNRSGEGKEGYEVVTSSDLCFENCTGLTDYSSIPEYWK